MDLLYDWREWASTNLTPGGRDRGSWASGNRVYGDKSLKRSNFASVYLDDKVPADWMIFRILT